jgi:hypothetical protein
VFKSFELTIYCDTDKFSSNLCYDDSRRHSEKLAQFSRGSSGGNVNVSNPNKWHLNLDDLVIDESVMLGQVEIGKRIFLSFLILPNRVDLVLCTRETTRARARL